MATINLGAIKFNWRGAYSGATAYVVDDVVESSGSSYICIAATTGNAPPNASYWEQMSSAGTNGTDGTDLGTTLTTQGDIVYRDASGLARLGAGTSGQVLQTNGTGANPSWGTVSSDAVKVYSASNVGGSNQNVDFDNVFTDTYTHYKVHIAEAYTNANPGDYLRLRLIDDSGSVLTSSNWNFARVYAFRNTSNGDGVGTPGNQNQDYFPISWQGQVGYGASLVLDFHLTRNSSKPVYVTSHGFWWDNNDHWASGIGGGEYKANTNARGFRLYGNNSTTYPTITNIQIYGFKN